MKKKAKIAFAILATIVAIQTVHILTIHLVLIPEYEATISVLRDYLEEAWTLLGMTPKEEKGDFWKEQDALLSLSFSG